MDLARTALTQEWGLSIHAIYLNKHLDAFPGRYGIIEMVLSFTLLLSLLDGKSSYE